MKIKVLVTLIMVQLNITSCGKLFNDFGCKDVMVLNNNGIWEASGYPDMYTTNPVDSIHEIIIASDSVFKIHIYNSKIYWMPEFVRPDSLIINSRYLFIINMTRRSDRISYIKDGYEYYFSNYDCNEGPRFGRKDLAFYNDGKYGWGNVEFKKTDSLSVPEYWPTYILDTLIFN